MTGTPEGQGPRPQDAAVRGRESVTTARPRRWRWGVAAVAVAAVAGLGGYTLAGWSDRADVPEVGVGTGALDLELVADPAWAVVPADGTASSVDPATHSVMPGQRLRMTVSWQVTARGDNSLAELTFGDVTLDGRLARHVDLTTAKLGVLAGTIAADAPDAVWETPLVTAGLGDDLVAISVTSDDDQATYTTYLDITVSDDVTFDDLEDAVLRVVNLDADLTQIRPGA